MPSAAEKARKVFRERGGTLRTQEALAAGVHRRTLYAMRERGELDCLARGLYRLAELSPLSEPDLAIVAKRIPRGVICLISALAFHELTTQVPHVVHLALPRTPHRTPRSPKIDYPPIQVYRFSEKAHEAGIDTHEIDRIPVRIYAPEKTIADCFKFRNKIGLDIAIEALQTYRRRRRSNLQKILDYARICRVEDVMRPYLEAGG